MTAADKITTIGFGLVLVLGLPALMLTLQLAL
jgi:hypothetical protein